MTAATGTDRFVVLDSWRGIAALAVALFHLPFAGVLAGSGLARHAFVFVDFFFVLSGFVIMHGYGHVVHGPGAAGAFLLRRLARLYPLHLVTLGVLLAVQFLLVGALASGLGGGGVAGPFTGLFPPGGLGLHAAFLTVFGLDGQLTWNVPAWSVAAEFWAYGVFAVLIVITAGRPQLRTAAFAMAAVTGAALVVTGPAGQIDVTHDLGLARCCYGFFIGALCRVQFDTLPPARPGVTARGSLAEIAVVGLMVLFVVAAGRTPVSLIAPFVFVMVVLVFARQQGVLSAFLRGAPFRALGRWSYGIYLWQFPMSYAVSLGLGLTAALGGPELRVDDPAMPGRRLVDLGPVWLNDLATIGFLAGLVLVAAVSFRLIEEPARLWIIRQWGGPPNARPA